jgi:hypothetical protein
MIGSGGWHYTASGRPFLYAAGAEARFSVWKLGLGNGEKLTQIIVF